MEILMYKKFPQEKLKLLIIKMQKLMQHKNKLNNSSFKRRYNQIMKELYPILKFIQYTQINKKVVHLNSKVRTSYSNLQEGYGNYQEDLVFQQIERMIDYIPKIDTKRKISNVLYIIQVKSTRIYFYSTIISPKLQFYPLDTENESNPLLIDNNYTTELYTHDNDSYTHDDVEKRFKQIQKKIYLDYYFNKISYIKFLKYNFLIHMLYFFMHEDKHSDLFINLYKMNIYKNNVFMKTVKLIFNVYKIYSKTFVINKYNNLNIGVKTIQSLIKNYFN